MLKSNIKYQKSNIKYTNQNQKILNFCLSFCILIFAFCISTFAQEQFVYDAQGKRNPFIPLLTPEGRFLKLDREEAAANGDLTIEGIIYDKKGRSFAIVAGSVVGVGDSVGDYQVLKVEETRVIFIKNGEPKEVEFKKEEP